jgi:hypothetical protein
MRRIYMYLICCLFFLGIQASTKAQDILIPAGTLLHCTLDEPNLSSATANVGDPVVCHLSSLQEFGHVVFPRGSYLGGHVEATKEPGHFVGKGYLKLEFDRIGLPTSDLPVPSKIIAARGFKVDKQGDIVGHGHAKRDIVEWMLPPLWPWKVLTLPARGPRPALKGEEPITLRLMDDVIVPRMMAAADYPNRPPSYDRLQPSYNRMPTYDRVQPSSYDRPPASRQPAALDQPKPVDRPAAIVRTAAYVAPSTPATENAQPSIAPGVAAQGSTDAADRANENGPVRLTMIALKSNRVYGVRKYRIDNGSLSFVLANGERGSVDIMEVDWRKTSQLNTGKNAVTTASYSSRASD